jgi:glycerol transport system ATP-binding protein
MARIRLADVAHSYRPDPRGDADYALQPLDLVWEDGGAYALLGPSGSGKTTILNILSGLLVPTRGRVLFGDEDVTRKPPRARNIAQVFQFPVIYDTMTVAENLAFPLRNRGLPTAEIRARVAEIAELLDLTGDLGRRASGLTADAKQRISMGRGLVRRDVAAILFDEPLTVIDPHLKWLLRRKLKQIHEQLRVTLVYVTHDQTEALTFADRVVVMNDGRVLQQGTPQELFEDPADAFVGHFIGSPGMNLMPCQIIDRSAVVGGQRVALAVGAASAPPTGAGRLQLGIRPEFVRLVPAPGASALSVRVEAVEHLGTYCIVTALLGDVPLKLRAPETFDAAPRSAIQVWFPPERVKIYADGRDVARSMTEPAREIA